MDNPCTSFTQQASVDNSSNSLTKQASVAVIASLWNHPDILADIKEFILQTPNFKPWEHIETKVISLLHNLLIPEELRPVLNNLVQPMGIQVHKWIKLTESTFQICPNLPESIGFLWCHKGSLNYCKTAKLFIESSSDDLLCYFLACIFCIGKTVRELWRHVEAFFSGKKFEEYETLKIPKAVIYWTYYLAGKYKELQSHKTLPFEVRGWDEFGFLYLFNSGYVPCLKHFARLIKPYRLRELAVRISQNISHNQISINGDTFALLFSCLNILEIKRLIIRHHRTILFSMLDWTCLNYFMPIAKCCWTFLREKDFEDLLIYIVDLVSRYYVSDVYRSLFVQFWKASPSRLRQSVISSSLPFTLFLKLYSRKYAKQITQMIFDDSTEADRKQMIFSFGSLCVCRYLTEQEDWEALKFLLKSCIPDKASLDALMRGCLRKRKLYDEGGEYENVDTKMFAEIIKWY